MAVKKENSNKTNGNSTKVPYKKKAKVEESEEKKELKKLYQKYLRSDQFKEVKEIVHQRDKVCQTCGRTEEECINAKTHLQVHHREYTALGKGGEEEAETCILLCGCCHRGLHSAKSNLRRFTDKSPILTNWKELKK